MLPVLGIAAATTGRIIIAALLGALVGAKVKDEMDKRKMEEIEKRLKGLHERIKNKKGK